jgi:chromosome segregation ATPase
MLDRKKSLQGVEIFFELLVEKAKELREELSTCESKCQVCPKKLDKTRATITTLTASLKDLEVDLQFHEKLVKRELNKIKDGEVDFKDVHERFHFVSKDLNVLDLKCSCTKQWVQSLGHQI